MFAQWHYHSQWGLTEAWLLLIENFSQYPARRREIPSALQCFEVSSGDQLSQINRLQLAAKQLVYNGIPIVYKDRVSGYNIGSTLQIKSTHCSTCRCNQATSRKRYKSCGSVQRFVMENVCVSQRNIWFVFAKHDLVHLRRSVSSSWFLRLW